MHDSHSRTSTKGPLNRLPMLWQPFSRRWRGDAAYRPKQCHRWRRLPQALAWRLFCGLPRGWKQKSQMPILDVLTLLVRKSKTAKRGTEKSVAKLQAFKQQLLKSLPIWNNNMLNRNRPQPILTPHFPHYIYNTFDAAFNWSA
jgi:hypothetical protein